jgi:hypothetical protein
MDRQIVAAALLRRLAEGGIHLNEPYAAADWLAPLLCTSARDQGALRARIEAEIPALDVDVSQPETARPIKTLARAEDAARTVGRSWLVWVAIASGITILLASLFAPTITPQDTGGKDPTVQLPTTLPTTWLGAMPLLLAVLVGVIMAAVIARSRYRERVRTAVAGPSAVQPFHGGGLPWFNEGSLRTSLRSLRRHLTPHGRFLNLPMSIRKTVRQAGVPVIVRGGRPKLPEHVVLAELNHAEDQLRVPVEALLRCLSEGGVHSDAYAFFGRPHVVHSWTSGEMESLQRVALRNHGARLLVISDGRPFYDRLADAALKSSALDDFAEHVLLVPELIMPPSLAIQALQRAGWFVVEFRSEGVQRIAEWLLSPRDYEATTDDAAADDERSSPRFDLEPAIADGRRVPSPQGAAVLLDQLRDWLGERAFALFAILAVQPRISPATTDDIAGQLTMLGVSMPSEASLARLTNLPWMRRGELPNWLRTALVERIPEELREKARAAWLLHLVGETAPRRYSTASVTETISPDDLNQLRDAAIERIAPGDRSDPLIRGMIGESPGAHGSTRLIKELDWRTAGAALLSAASAAFATYFVTTHARQLAGLVMQAANFIAPFSGDVVNIALVSVALLMIAPRLPIVNVGLAALAGLVAGLVLVASFAAEPEVAIRHLCLAESLIALLAYRWFTADPPSPLVVRAVFSRAHPWANAAVVVVLIGYAASPSLHLLLGDSSVVMWMVHEAAMLSLGAFMAAALGFRMTGQGAASKPAIVRAAYLYLVGQALAGVVFFIVFDSESRPLFDIGWSNHAEVVWIFDASARLVGGITAALLAFEQPRWPAKSTSLSVWSLLPRIPLPSTFIFAYGIVFTVALPVDSVFSTRIAESAANLGIPGTLFRPVAAYGPWLPISLIGIRLVLSWVGRIPVADRLILAALTSLVTAVIASQFIAPAITEDQTVISLFNQACWLASWLLLWPTIQFVGSGHVMSPRDGLWWRCLLLIPCTISVARIGALHQLALPGSAWIAMRYGGRAFPAMSLALVPLMLCIAIDLSIVAVSPGLGWGLAALLAAMFATDAKLRASVLAQDRVTVPQTVMLCLLMIELDVGISSFQINADLYPLALTLLAFIGLSRAPLRRLIITLAVIEIAGAFFEWGSKGINLPVFRFFLGYPGLAGFVTVVVVLVGARLIRSTIDHPLDSPVGTAWLDEPRWNQVSPSELQARVVGIDLPQPIKRLLLSFLGLRGQALWIVVGLIALDCVGVSISLGGVLLDPFVRYQLFLVGLGIGVTDRVAPHHRIALLQWLAQWNVLSRVPEPHRMAVAIGIVAFVLSAIPELEISILPLNVRFASFFQGSLANALIVGSFYYVGRMLPGVIATRPLADVSSVTVWDSAPVKTGIGAAVLCIAGTIAAVVFTLALAFRQPVIVKPPSSPQPAVTEAPSPTPASPAQSIQTPVPPPLAQPEVRNTPTPDPSPPVQSARPPVQNDTVLQTEPTRPAFRCQESKDPNMALKSFYNPQTGTYDRTVQVPRSECAGASLK